MYVLSHGFLLSSYKAFLHLHTWFYLSCSPTPTGCKYLFVVYALFPWEASCYESFLVFHDASIYCMLDMYGRHYRIPLRSRHRILDIIPLDQMVLFDHSLLPFILGYFFIARRLCINDVVQQCHITTLCLRPLVSLKVWSYYSSSWIELSSLVLRNKSHPSFLVGDCMRSFLQVKCTSCMVRSIS